MKKLLILLFLFPYTVFSQANQDLDLCKAFQANNFMNNVEAEKSLNRILGVIGASKNFVLLPCENISNAVATAYKGTRYILYDKEFMDLINKNTNNWSNLFILAHEVGHHINGHSIDILLYAGDIIDIPSLKKKRKQELEADEFAAFVLAKLGATLFELNNVIKLISTNEDDSFSTHPKRDKRLASVKRGYNKGYVKKANKTVIVNVESQLNDYKIGNEYIKYGNWYRKQKSELFGVDQIESFTIGSVNGDTEKYNFIPKLTFLTKPDALDFQTDLFFDVEQDVFTPDCIGRISYTIVILDTNKNKIYQKRLSTRANPYKRGYQLFYKGSGFLLYDNPIKELKKGSYLVIKFDGYTKGQSEDSIYWELLYNSYLAIKDNYPSLQEIPHSIVNYKEVKMLGPAYENFQSWFNPYKKKCGTAVGRDSCKGIRRLDKTIRNNLCNCQLDSDFKIYSVLHKLQFSTRERAKEIAKRNQFVDLKDVYFEFSLSGSAKALSSKKL